MILEVMKMSEEFNLYALGAELIRGWAKKVGKSIFEAIRNKYHDIDQKEKIDYGTAFET